MGSFPSAYLISKKLKNIDIREVGDRNPGARNVYINVGKFEGVLTFIIDFLKGFIPVFVFLKIFNKENLSLISGFGAVIGHDFSIFLKFYGGKAISTIYGIFFSIFPIQTFLALITFLILFTFKKHFDHSIAFSFIVFLFLLFLKREKPALIFYCIILLLTIGIKKLIDYPREKLSYK